MSFTYFFKVIPGGSWFNRWTNLLGVVTRISVKRIYLCKVKAAKSSKK